MLAASLTCQTLAQWPEVRAPPGLFVSCRTQLLLPPVLQDRRVEGGTETGKAATGPEPREVYIGGAGAREGNCVLHLPHQQPTTVPGNSIEPTSVRCSRTLARRSPPPAAARLPAATPRPLATCPPPSCGRWEEYTAHA